MNYRYQPDEDPKKKHAWGNDHAGFVEVHGVHIGKCPKGVSLAQAEALLNGGIPFSPRGHKQTYPKHIYIVHDRVVYRGTPTVPGISYHAFPEMPSKLRELPGRVRDAIMERARSLGCEDQIRRWMQGTP